MSKKQNSFDRKTHSLLDLIFKIHLNMIKWSDG